MAAMPLHALILCSRRRALPLRLLEHPALTRVSVLVESGHTHDFPAGVAVHEVSDIFDTTEVLKAAVAIGSAHPIDRVVAPVEFSVAAAGHLRSSLGLPGPGYDTALAFCNKYVMKQRLAEAGLPVAAFTQAFSLEGVPAAADVTGWPAVVKPVFGGACMNVKVLPDAGAVHAFIASPESAGLRDSGKPVAVERFVPMEGEFHIDAVVHGGEVLFASVSRYFTPLLAEVGAFIGSWFLPEDHPDFAPALALNEQVVSALGLREGVTHLELYKTADGFVIGEIACRPAGNGVVDAVREQYGVDLWDAFMDAALGLRPEVKPQRGELIVVNTGLPTTAGRITALSTAEELSACPGVFSVRMTRAVGETVSDDLNSSTTTALILYTAADEAEVHARLRTISETYVLVTEPLPAAPLSARHP